MFRACNSTFRVIRKYSTALKLTPNLTRNFPSLKRVKNVLLTSQLFNYVKENKENIEEILLKTHVEGKEGYIDLINILKEFILEACENYQDCLRTQIELTRQATKLGPLSNKWDDLPEYRTLASDLNYELTIYITLFRSLDAMIKINEDIKRAIYNDYKELAKIFDLEFDKNKLLENELLDLKCASIKKGDEFAKGEQQ